MDEVAMRRRVAEARAARVGTLDERGRAHLVPIVYVIDGDTLYSSTDAGPRPVKRLRNLQWDPRVTVLVDVYDEDWSKVWWVRLRGSGRAVEEGPEWEHARRLLWEKYPQFQQAPAEEGAGPIMAVDVEEWSGWAYTPG
jgi:PPOX class probable F420-dependent enzyme